MYNRSSNLEWKVKTVNIMSIFLQPSLNIKNKGTGVIAVLKWSLPTSLPSQFICSPIFEKWGRRWRLFAKDGSLALKYAQGVESICLDVRCASIVY